MMARLWLFKMENECITTWINLAGIGNRQAVTEVTVSKSSTSAPSPRTPLTAAARGYTRRLRRHWKLRADHDLDGDRAVEAGVVGAIHFAPCTCTEGRQNFIRAKTTSSSDGHRRFTILPNSFNPQGKRIASL
jgi:hypothetical protein